MGAALCTRFGQKPIKVLYVGLDAAGKTTLLYKLKLGEVVTTIPTIGFNVETLTVNGVQMVAWDVGTRDKSRALLRHYTAGVDAFLFVVDSTDRERLEEAVDIFFNIIAPEVEERQVPVLVLANKQDCSRVMTPDEIKKAILSKREIKGKMEVFPTVALTLEGVDPALNCLTSQLAVKLARDSYLPSISSVVSKAIDYPASLVKNSYLKVASLLASGE